MQDVEAKPQIPFSIGRMIMMSVLSIILVCSVYFTVFTPYPLGLAIILFGRKVGFGVIALATVVFYALTVSYIQDFTVFGLYLVSAFIGIVIGEMILRRLNPLRGIVTTLIGLILIVGGGYLSQKSTIDAAIKSSLIEKIETIKPILEPQIEEMKSSPEGSAYAAQTFLEKPGPFIDDMIKTAPGYIIMGFVLMLWLNTFLLLKSQRLVRNSEQMAYSEKVLLNFKMPDQFIFPVLLGLGMYMWGDSYMPWLSNLGLLVIQVLGLFYFFQGFGIYMAFLDHYKIGGIFRSILMVLTILVAYQMIALVGLFDMFVNFRKYFKKENPES